MKRRIVGGCVISLGVAVVLGGGCTEPPIGWEGAGRQQDLPPPAIDASISDGEGGLATLPGLCAPQGVYCHSNSDCCNGDCLNGVSCSGLTGGPFCAPNGVVCQQDSDCCDGYCGGGVCGNTPSPGCAPEFVQCTTALDCCNASTEGGAPEGGSSAAIQCVNGACCGVQKVCGDTTPPPLCIPYGVFCTSTSQCCTGVCTLNIDLLYVCDIPPPPTP